MKIALLTIFPEIFSSFLETSLIGKAIDRGLLDIRAVNIRTFAEPPHYTVDDTPYGGGAGMVMRPEPLAKALEHTKQQLPQAKTVLMSPAGVPFSQSKAQNLKLQQELILLCGRYEGIDQRIIDAYVDEEISIGDYVIMGGEVAAMVVIEATTRLIEQVLGNADSVRNESFANSRGDGLENLLEAPHYTRPPEFAGKKVPEVLLSGNHSKIEEWRREQAFERTRRLRPDLLPNKGK